MKKYLLFMTMVLLSIFAQAQKTMYICKGLTYSAVDITTAGEMPLGNNGTTITINEIGRAHV